MEGKITNFSSNYHIFYFKLEILRQNLPDILSGDDKFSTWPAQILSYMSDDPINFCEHWYFGIL